MKRNSTTSTRATASTSHASKPDTGADPEQQQQQQQQQQQGAEGSESRQADPEEIAVAAYHIYLSKGAEDGNDVDHWLEAERNLINSASSSG